MRSILFVVMLSLVQVVPGLILFAEPPKPNPVFRVPAMIVVDSANEQVGELVSLLSESFGSASPVVMIRNDEEPILLRVEPDRLRGFEDVYYLNADCTGPAYVRAPEISLHYLNRLQGYVYVVDEQHLLLRSRDGTAPQSQSIQSRWSRDLGDTSCHADFFSNPVVPVDAVLDLTSIFTPPFRLE